MTIATTTRTAGPFTGTGANTNFPFAFKVFQASDLLVTQVDTGLVQSTLVLGSAYTVAVNSDQNVAPGGVVTLLAPLPTGYTLTLTSAVPMTQSASLTNAGGFFPRTIEDALDRLTILMQQLGFSASQTVRTTEIGGIPPLPAASLRANNLLGFDSLGNPVAVAPANGSAAALATDLANSAAAAKGAGQIGFTYGLAYGANTVGQWLSTQAARLVDLAASSGSSLIGWIQSGTGTVTRTVQTKLREIVTSADFNNTRGTGNVGVGPSVLANVLNTGNSNTGVGDSALSSLTTGFGNTALGYHAGKNITSPGYSTAIGAYALENADQPANVNLIATAVGAYALNAVVAGGQYNVGVGGYAGMNITVGYFNTAVGTSALKTCTSGFSNTAIGYAALALGTGNYCVAVGDSASTNQAGALGTVAIGFNALTGNVNGNYSVAIGYAALAQATGGANIGIGRQAGYSLQTGTDNIAIGDGALTTANLAGSRSVAIGSNALGLLTSNSDNTAVGYNALSKTVNGGSTAVGSGALANATNGGPNDAFGKNAGGNVTTGANNIFVGQNAGTDAVANVTTASNQLVLGTNNITNAFIKVALTVTSDARDKTDVAPITQGLAFVSQLKPVSFKLMDRDTQQPTTGTRYGFLAQDVLALEGESPVIVDADVAEHLKLRESMLVPTLVKAIQELKAEFDAYKAAHP